MALHETDVPVRNVITTDPEQAKALENDVRAKILDMTADRAMAVGEIHEELARRGEDLVETTVRHHVNVLREAGLLEIARLEDVRGGMRKYYKANTRVFAYELPADAEDELAPARDAVRTELETLLEELFDDHGTVIRAVAREMTPCQYCETQRYEEFIVRELLDRALTDLSEDSTFDELADP